jgi:hypothetical protein
MAGPGGVLTLDLSLTVGWAYGCLGQRPNFGHWFLGKMARPGAVYAVLEDEIDDAIKLHCPAHVVYEAPFAPQIQTSVEVGKLLLGLCAIVELICCRHTIECHHQEVRRARKAVLGSNPSGGPRVVKPIIMDWAKRRGWDTAGQDDAADALVLLQYAVVKLDRTGSAHFMKHGETL